MKTTTQARTETRPFDVEAIRRDFPALHQNVNGRPLIYLDNAASAQKPQVVIDAVVKFYSRDNSNVHRALASPSARVGVTPCSRRTPPRCTPQKPIISQSSPSA